MTSVHRIWRFPDPPEGIWQALTERDALADWLLPNDFAARVGHRFTLRGGRSLGLPEVVHCEVLELDPPRRLVLGWSDRPGPPQSVVEFDVRARDGGSELRIHHHVVELALRAGREPVLCDWEEDLRWAFLFGLRRDAAFTRTEVRQ